jgi:homotetrameric cytidine deaminase
MAKKISKAELDTVFQEAKAARKRAYAPYSEFFVGAALLLDNGDILPGCNVENASYGGTICAERTAFISAVARYSNKFEARALVLVTEPLATPCGLCLQVISEFCSPQFPIYLATPKGIKKKVEFKKLMPHTFDRSALE